ncbi:MAG: DEAD/DEAH box helicase [Proteobacteria bacterium]|nr:DEAD/DEAH box helicase [Pseudomonadota bacterium]
MTTNTQPMPAQHHAPPYQVCRFALEPSIPPELNALPKLTPPQQICLSHAIRIIEARRALLLCEETGSGKTYIASALAAILEKRKITHHTLLIAPTHLIPMWTAALKAFHIHPTTCSFQCLSLGHNPTLMPDATLVLVDEAHGFKNPSTKRTAQLAQIASNQYLCLITATPVSLCLKDLHTLMRLCGYPSDANLIHSPWLRDYARAITPQAYACPLPTCSVQARHSTLPYPIEPAASCEALARIAQHANWLVFKGNDDDSTSSLLPSLIIDRLLSHPSACYATMKRLERYYASCMKHGSMRPLSRREYQCLFGTDGAQYPLPFMYPKSVKSSRCLKQHLNHLNAQIQNALQLLQEICRNDEKIKTLQRFIDTIPNEQQTIIFTQFADTARYLAKHLAKTRKIALITASDCHYASLPASRGLIHAMFDPNATTHTPIPPAQILICTDVMASGHNLQRASVLIHFDHPYNPTILKQREGRLLRLHQTSHDVQIINMCPRLLSNAMQKHFDKRKHILKQRQIQQADWVTNTPKRPEALNAMTFTIAQLPCLCVEIHGHWLPVHPNIAIHAGFTHIKDMPIASAFEKMSPGTRKVLKDIWTALKKWIHLPNASQRLSDLPKITLALGLYPQLEKFLSLPSTIDFDPHPLFQRLHALPKSAPANLTPASLWIMYPQHATSSPIPPPDKG